MPGFSSPKSPLTTAVFLYDEHVLNLAPTVLFLQLSTENKQGNKKRKKTGLAKSFNLYILQYHFQHLSTAWSSVLHWLLSPILSPPTKEGPTGSLPRLGSPTLDPIGESHQGALLQREQ